MKKFIFLGILFICVVTLIVSHKNSDEVFLKGIKEDIKGASEVVVKENINPKDSIQKDYQVSKRITDKSSVDRLVDLISDIKISSKPSSEEVEVEQEKIFDFFNEEGKFLASIKFPFEFNEIKYKFIILDADKIEEIERITGKTS